MEKKDKPKRVAVPPHPKVRRTKPKTPRDQPPDREARSKSREERAKSREDRSRSKEEQPKAKETRRGQRMRPGAAALAAIRPQEEPLNPQAIYNKAILEKDFITAGIIFYDHFMTKVDKKELQASIKRAFPIGSLKGRKQLDDICRINMATNIEKYDSFYVSLYNMIDDGLLNDQHGGTIVINEEVADVALKLAKLTQNKTST